VTDAADLVVWRHGRTAWNESGRFQGHLDPPLDPVGHDQARAAAVALNALAPSAVVSSDLSRAAATAAYLGTYETDPRLREIDVGEWGGLTRPEIEARFPDTYAAWLRGEDVRHEGGETVADVAARVRDAVLARLAASGAAGPLVVVTHGGAARALVVALLGLPVSARAAFEVLDNAHWAALRRRGDGWRLHAYNVGGDPAGGAARRDDAGAGPVL
jgi:probable phosphoglycerate mutase